MACDVVAFVAHKASAALENMLRGYLKICLRYVRLHMSAKHTLKLNEVSGASCLSAFFGVTQSAQMDVVNSSAGKRLR